MKGLAVKNIMAMAFALSVALSATGALVSRAPARAGTLTVPATPCASACSSSAPLPVVDVVALMREPARFDGLVRVTGKVGDVNARRGVFGLSRRARGTGPCGGPGRACGGSPCKPGKACGGGTCKPSETCGGSPCKPGETCDGPCQPGKTCGGDARKACTGGGCGGRGRVQLPVAWKGQMPQPGDAVVVAGRVRNSGCGLVLEASQVRGL